MQKLLIIILITMNLTTVLNGAVIENVYYADKINKKSVQMELKGTALLKYLVVIKAYVGGFYMESGKPVSSALEDVPKRLELSYFVKIEADGFAKATREMIVKNTTKSEFNKIRAKVKLFNSYYKDVKPGDRYAITYVPGKGTTLELNGKSQGIVKGYLFSKALFSIWIGRNPIDKNFRKEILGL